MTFYRYFKQRFHVDYQPCFQKLKKRHFYSWLGWQVSHQGHDTHASPGTASRSKTRNTKPTVSNSKNSVFLPVSKSHPLISITVWNNFIFRGLPLKGKGTWRNRQRSIWCSIFLAAKLIVKKHDVNQALFRDSTLIYWLPHSVLSDNKNKCSKGRRANRGVIEITQNLG